MNRVLRVSSGNADAGETFKCLVTLDSAWKD